MAIFVHTVPLSTLALAVSVNYVLLVSFVFYYSLCVKVFCFNTFWVFSVFLRYLEITRLVC